MSIRSYTKEELGQGLVEYAMIMVMVALFVMSTLFLTKDGVSGCYQYILDNINAIKLKV